MIISRRDGALTIVRQVDHQEQCALMAESWGSAEFAPPEPYEPLIDAARWHDEGWRAWEEAPEVGEAGRPLDFPDVDRAVHVDLYRASIARAFELGPRAGLLVSMHGQGLYEGRLGLDGPAAPRDERPPAVRDFLTEQDGRQREARAALEPGPELDAWAWAGYRLLQAWDVLSLYLLWKWLPARRELTMPRVPRSAGDPGVDIRLRPAGPLSCTADPFPFPVDTAALPVPARTIPDRPYVDDDDLRAELAGAEWVTLGCVVGRP